LEEFDSGVVFIKKPAPSCNAVSKLPISRTVDSDKKAAVRASIKLDADDVKGAIRVFSSDDAFVIPNYDRPPLEGCRRAVAKLKRRSQCGKLPTFITSLMQDSKTISALWSAKRGIRFYQFN